MRSRRGFFLMELVIGLAVLAIAISLAAAVFSQSRIADQKLQQYRDAIHLQQSTALQMLLTGKSPANSNDVRIQAISVDQTLNLPAGYHWISVSRETGSSASVPLFILWLRGQTLLEGNSATKHSIPFSQRVHHWRSARRLALLMRIHAYCRSIIYVLYKSHGGCRHA